MKLFCLVAGHKAVPSNIWNDGHFFSRCTRCDCELIGRGGIWRSVPRGYRVVWRSGMCPSQWTPLPLHNFEGTKLSDWLPTTTERGYPTQYGMRIVAGNAAPTQSATGSVVEGLNLRAAAG